MFKVFWCIKRSWSYFFSQHRRPHLLSVLICTDGTDRQTTHFGHESVGALSPASSSLINPQPCRLFFLSFPDPFIRRIIPRSSPATPEASHFAGSTAMNSCLVFLLFFPLLLFPFLSHSFTHLSPCRRWDLHTSKKRQKKKTRGLSC